MSKSKRRGRGTSDTANRRLPLSPPYSLSPYDYSRQLSFDFKSALRALEDRRTYHPEGDFRPAQTFRSPRYRIVVADRPRMSRRPKDPLRLSRSLYRGTKATLAFEAPQEVAICIRRQRRKEVLHAKQKTGRGKGKQRRPRRNAYSKISCGG